MTTHSLHHYYRFIVLGLLCLLIAGFSLSALAMPAKQLLGYGYGDECSVTRPRVFRMLAHTKRLVSFSWKRPKETCDQKVKLYTVVARSVKNKKKELSVKIKAPRHKTTILTKNLFGKGRYEVFVKAKMKDGTASKRSRIIRFIVR